IRPRNPNYSNFKFSKPQCCKGFTLPKSPAADVLLLTLNLFLLQIIFSDGIKLYMALRGVWQLRKLVVSYCNWGGSSRGIRAFMESELPALKEKNPHLEVVTELNRGQHPFLKGLYKNKNERVVCVKNLSQDEVLEAATKLRNSLGRKVVKLKTRHVTKQPSVQGTWSTALEL
ncbi:hypothetical protein H5410_020435, partial [Solanum commersonii]